MLQICPGVKRRMFMAIFYNVDVVHPDLGGTRKLWCSTISSEEMNSQIMVNSQLFFHTKKFPCGTS